LLRPCRQRPRRRRATEQGEEIAPSHELPSNEAHNLAHHWTMRALCIAAKYSRLCRFRVILHRAAHPAKARYVGRASNSDGILCTAANGGQVCHERP
jgi:hypothetical protein